MAELPKRLGAEPSLCPSLTAPSWKSYSSGTPGEHAVSFTPDAEGDRGRSTSRTSPCRRNAPPRRATPRPSMRRIPVGNGGFVRAVDDADSNVRELLRALGYPAKGGAVSGRRRRAAGDRPGRALRPARVAGGVARGPRATAARARSPIVQPRQIASLRALPPPVDPFETPHIARFRGTCPRSRTRAIRAELHAVLAKIAVRARAPGFSNRCSTNMTESRSPAAALQLLEPEARGAGPLPDPLRRRPVAAPSRERDNRRHGSALRQRG